MSNVDANGDSWWGWLAAAVIVTTLVVASVVTCGGAAVAAGTACAIVTGSCTTVGTAATVLTGTAVGASTAFAASVIIASDEAQTVEEFADYGEQALFNTVVGGGVGALQSLENVNNYCFIAGTLICTESGNIPVEQVKAGDFVWAWDEITGDISLKPVVETYINETSELTHVFVADEEIICTPGHRFYAPQKGWTEACRLRAGDILVLVNGEYVVVEKIQHELLEAPIKVYNFQVEDYHTYFVAATGVLVHNDCGKKEVHHVVEQCQQGKSGFSAADIQSDSNKVTIPYEMHRKISGYYSSKQPFSDGLKVRDWLAGKTFTEQSEFGWSVIMHFWE